MSKKSQINNQHTEKNLQQLEQELMQYLNTQGGEILRCDSCRHHCPLRIPGCFRGRKNAEESGVEIDEFAVKLFFGEHNTK